MNCKRCGAEITVGQKFCGTCGAPVSEPVNTGYAQQVPPQQPNMGGYANNPRQPYGATPTNGPWNPNPAFSEKPRKPKNNKKPLIIVAVLAIVALVAALAVILVPIVKRAFMSEQERFAMHDRRVIEDVLEAVSEVSEETKGNAEYSGSIAINLSDSMKDQLGAYIGDISSAKITLDVARSGKNGGCKIGILLGATELMTLDVVIDTESGKVFVEVPGLIDGALELDLGELLPEMSALSVLAESGSSVEVSDAVIAEVLELIDVTYGATYGMEESKGVLEVDGISQKCTVYTLEIDQEMACKMAKAFFTQLKKSDSIKEFAYDVAVNYSELADFEVTRESISDQIDEMADDMLEELAYIEEYDQEGAIIYKIYVDGDEAIGRVIELPDDTQIKLVCAKNGRDVAFEYSVLSYYGSSESGIKLAGGGKEDKSGFTGDASLYVEDCEIADLAFDKFKCDDDKLSGSVELTFGSDIEELGFDYDVAAVLATAKITLTFDVDSDESKIGIGISAMNFDLGEILIEGKEGTKYAPKIPDDVSYSDIETFGDSIDVYELLARLSEAGLDLSGLMGGY